MAKAVTSHNWLSCRRGERVSVLAAMVVVCSLAIVAIGATAGCGPDEPIDLVEPPHDPEAGPYGVAVLERQFRVRLDDAVDTLVYLPLERPGQVADGPFPVVLLVHGGRTEPYQYGWLARHFARRGYLVVAPSHPFGLAIFATGNGGDVVEAVHRASQRTGDVLEGLVDNRPAIATGHSLGGVVATKTWLRQPERFSHLLLLQSIPDSADADELDEPRADDHQVFAIAGGRDGRISADEVAEELELFADDVPLAVVEGQNHFQLVDGPEPRRFADDDIAAIEAEEGRRLVLQTVDLFLDAYRLDDESRFTDPGLWPDGVVPYEEFSEQ